jgi:hypothetical protein
MRKKSHIIHEFLLVPCPAALDVGSGRGQPISTMPLTVKPVVRAFAPGEPANIA